MSKSHRGKGILELAAHGRGVCARCKKEGIKVLYEQEIDGQKAKICNKPVARYDTTSKTVTLR